MFWRLQNNAYLCKNFENMTDKEYRVYLETRLRNLKRKYSRLIQHSDLTDVTKQTQKEIQEIEAQLQWSGKKLITPYHWWS